MRGINIIRASSKIFFKGILKGISKKIFKGIWGNFQEKNRGSKVIHNLSTCEKSYPHFINKKWITKNKLLKYYRQVNILIQNKNALILILRRLFYMIFYK